MAYLKPILLVPAVLSSATFVTLVASPSSVPASFGAHVNADAYPLLLRLWRGRVLAGLPFHIRDLDGGFESLEGDLRKLLGFPRDERGPWHLRDQRRRVASSVWQCRATRRRGDADGLLRPTRHTASEIIRWRAFTIGLQVRWRCASLNGNFEILKKLAEQELMTFPYISSITAGLLLILQVLLAFSVSGARGQKDIWVGDGGQEPLLRAVRRHGNLAENAGLFVAGFTLLELSRFIPTLLTGLCAAFVLARLVHAVGLSQSDTRNGFRLFGGVGTYLIGLVLGGTLIWVGYSTALATRSAG